MFVLKVIIPSKKDCRKESIFLYNLEFISRRGKYRELERNFALILKYR